MGRPAILKDAIWQAALRLFIRKGVKSTSVRDIAREAGVSEGSLYRHWKSKLSLAWDLYTTQLQRLAVECEQNIERADTPRLRVQAFVQTCYEWFDREPDLFRFLLIEWHESWQPGARQDPGHPMHVWRRLVAAYLTGKNPAKFPPELLAAVSLGMIVQPAAAASEGFIATPLVQHVDTVSERIWATLDFGRDPSLD